MKPAKLSDIEEGKSYKLVKAGIKKHKLLSYFVDADGDISCKDSKDKMTKLAKLGIKKIPELYYFVDDDGDISVMRGAKDLAMELKKEEINAALLFKLAGFKVTNNVELKGSRIELMAERDNFRIICVCKYENSDESLRDTIYQWVNKNKEIGANKIIIALFGIEPLGEDKEMADRNKIIIWEEENIANYLKILRKDREEGTKKLLGDLDISSYCDPNITYEHTMDY